MSRFDTVQFSTRPTRSMTKKTLSYRRCIFVVISLAYFFVYFHRTSLAVMASELSAAFNIAPSTLGLFGSMYFYAYAAGQLPAGILADRWGARKTIMLFVFIAGLGAIVFGTAGSFFAALAGRFLVGFGVGFVYVPALRILSDWFKKDEFATFAGILVAVGNVGSLAAAAPLALLMSAIGWRGSMTAVGLVSIAIALLAYAFIRNKPQDIGGASMVEIQGMVQTDPAPAATGIPQSLRLIFRSFHFWSITLLYIGMYGSMMGFQGLWAGPYLTNVYAMTKSEAGKVLTMIPLGMILGCPLSGILSDKIFRSRKTVALAGAVCYTLTWLPLIFFTDTIPVPFLMGLLFIYGFFGGFCVVMYADLKENIDPRIAGTAIGLLNAFIFAGGAFFQQIMGVLIAKFPMVDQVIPAAAFQTAFCSCLTVMAAGTIVYGAQKGK